MSNKPIVNAAASHAWNKDQSKVALATNGEVVEMFNTNGAPKDPSKWKKEFTMEEHGGFVSAIDWHPETNAIVTCGHDRNAYVWKNDGKSKEWKPTLVILRINRAATAVKWCPNGKKFAVASGAKCVPVCHYQEKNDWWISKMIKKHKSSVVAVDWSPNNKFVVTGSTDFKCRVFSAFIDDIDSSDSDGFDFWDKQNTFGELLAEFSAIKAWINAVAWSPSGDTIAYSAHSAQIGFVDVKNGCEVQVVNDSAFPYASLEWVNADTLVGVGWAMNPTTFTGGNGSWKRAKEIDEKKAVAKKKVLSARDKFKAADSRGNKFGENASSAKEIQTIHKNVITNVRVVSKNEITTCGLDGRIVTWKI